MRNEQTEIKLGGMVCRACETAVEERLVSMRGVIHVKASYWRRKIKIEYDPDIVSLESMEAVLSNAGYPAGQSNIDGFAIDAICLLLTVLITWILLNINGSPVAQLMEDNSSASLAYVFLMGLLTSTHCIAMCGGIVLSQTTDAESLMVSRRSTLLSALWYNAGRVLSYTALGAVFGALGMVLSYTEKSKSLVFVMAGLAVLLMGLRMFGILPWLWGISARQTTLCELPIKARRRFAGKAFAVGVLTGLMPCAPLYAMWLYAMGIGSFIGGAVAMLCFSLGTVPLLAVFGIIGAFVPAKFYKYMLKISSVLVCSMGLKMLIKGILLSL